MNSDQVSSNNNMAQGEYIVEETNDNMQQLNNW